MANPNYWYARHFKDYAAKTAHLSLAEHGAYALLLDHYYQTNGKLMANAMAIARICRCQTEDEHNAVQSVLSQFFTCDDSGLYRNDRADKEMGIAANVSAARSSAGKAGAIKRWENSKVMANAIANDMANEWQEAWQNDTQQQPQQQSKYMSGKPDAAAILNYLNEKTGRNYKPVKSNLNLIAARLKEGATPDECRAVIDAKTTVWLGDSKMGEFLRPATLFNATKFAQYAGEISETAQFGGQSWE